MNTSNKGAFVIGAGILLLALGCTWLFSAVSGGKIKNASVLETPSPQVIGGDKDEGGCLVAAGYSWCAIRQKCLRVWEEPCVAEGQESASVLPASAETPAAGICAEAPEGEEVLVSVGDGMPSPRCQKVLTTQSIAVYNATTEPMTLWLGAGRNFSFSVLPGETYRDGKKAGNYLAPGVYTLSGASGQGPELWVVEPADK